MLDSHLPFVDIEVHKVTLDNFASDKEDLQNKLEIHFQKRFLGELDKIVSGNDETDDVTDLKRGNFRVCITPSETGLQALRETELYSHTRFPEGGKQIGYRIVKISPMDSFQQNETTADAPGNSIVPTGAEKQESIRYAHGRNLPPHETSLSDYSFRKGYGEDVPGRSILVEGKPKPYIPNETQGESILLDQPSFLHQTPDTLGASFVPTGRVQELERRYSRLDDARIAESFFVVPASDVDWHEGRRQERDDLPAPPPEELETQGNIEKLIGTYQLQSQQHKGFPHRLPHNVEVGMSELSLCTTISVTGYENVEPVLGYFSKKSSGGGKIDSYYEDHMTKTLYITFEDRNALSAVLSRTHHMDGCRLTVIESARPKRPPQRPVDGRRLLLCDLPETSTSESIKRFMGTVVRSDYPQVTFGSISGSAIVTYPYTIRDMGSVIDTIRRTPFGEKRISVEKVLRTNAIVVKGFKEGTYGNSIKFTFERKDVSEDVVKHVSMKTSRIALVYFHNVKDAEHVLNEENKYKLGGERLFIEPYYEGLGVPVEKSLPKPVISKVSWSIMNFIFSKRNHKEAFILEMSKEAAEVVWPYYDDNRKAEIRPKRNYAYIDWTDWEIKANQRFQETLEKYCGDSFRIPHGVEERVCKEWLNRLTSPVKTTISQGYIILCGLKTDVAESKSQLEIISKGGNVSLPESQVTTVPMKPYQVQLLELCGVKDTLEHDHPRVQIALLDNSPAQCSVQLRGHRDDIRDTRWDMRDFLDNIPSKKVELHPSQVQLMLRNQQHVFKIFQGKNVLATFVQDGDTSIMIYGKTDVHEAHQVIRDSVCFESLPCPDNVCQTFQSQSGEKFIEEMNKKYAMCVVSFEVGKQVVNMAAFKEELPHAKKDLRQFIEDNAIEEVGIQCPEDKLQYLEHSLKVAHSVKLPPGVTCKLGNDIIILQGRPGDVTKGQALVSDFLSGIVGDYHVVSKPGIQEISQDGIQQIQHMYNCKIDVVNSSAAAGNGNEVAPTRAQHASPKIKSRYKGPNGQEFLVCHGDITKECVDGLVNAANERLQHGGGVAAAFVREGGEIIQRESDEIQKRDGPLTTSMVVCTGPGKLPCQVLLHVVGPVYKDGYHHEVDQLHDAVTKVLREADRQKLRSIAMPAISSGIFKFPIKESTETIITATMVYFNQNEESTITEVRFTDTAEVACRGFQTTLEQYATEIHVSVSDNDKDIYGPTASTHLLSKDSLYAPEVTQVSSNTNTISTAEHKTITTIRGNIADQKADVIVNTVNVNVGLSHGKVSSAILSVAGKGLQKECNTNLKYMGGKLRHWQFLKSGPGLLDCRAVYHLSCGNYNGNDVATTETCFQSAMEELLMRANQDGMSTIAIPAIGTGHLGFPPSDVARLMYTAAISFSRQRPNGSLKDIRFIIYQHDEPVIQAFQQEMKKVMSNRSIRATYPITVGTGTASTKTFDDFNVGTDGVCRIKVGNIQILLQAGSIVEAGTDCLVNSTNSDFGLGAPLSQAILKAGGKQVEQECKGIGADELRKKSIVMTKAGNMPRTKNIMHVLVYHGRDPDFQKKIAKCLRMADENQMRSIAFPAIGTGKSPSNKVREVAEELLNAIGRFTISNPKNLNLVKIVIYQPQFFVDYREAMKTVLGRGYCKQRTGKLSLRGFKQRVCGSKSVSKKQVEDTSSICFHIFAKSQKNLLSAKGKLDELIQEQFTTQALPYNAQCIKFTDGRKERLRDKAEKHKTWLDFSMTEKDIKYKRIIVRGRNENIMEVMKSLPIMLSEFQQDDEIARKVQWCYKDGVSGAIVPYEEDINTSIERAFQMKEDFIDLENEDGMVVRIDLKNLEEIDSSSSQYGPRVKVIRRDLTQDDATKIPDDWDPNIDNEEKDLDVGSREYQDVERKFHASFPVTDRRQIISIKQIRYRLLYQKYQLSRKAMKERFPTGHQVERDLYHGTSDDTCQRIIKEGFNRSFHGKNATAYGRGTYFAQKSKYSVGYTNADSNKHRHMFQCKVLTGEYCKGDSSMIAPPIKPQSDDRYDSLVDNPQNPAIFVIFDDAHAYPEYLITFL